MRALVVVVIVVACGKAKPASEAAPGVADEAALALPAEKPALVVTIDSKGALAVAGKPVTLAELAPKDRGDPPREEIDDDDDSGPDGMLTESIMEKPKSPEQIERDKQSEYRRVRGLLGRRDDVVHGNPANWPKRVTSVNGAVVADRKLAPKALVVAAPLAPATALVDVVHATEGAIAVMHRGQLRMLPISFEHESMRSLNDTKAVEVRMRGDKLEVEPIPDVPKVVPLAELTSALDAARARRKLDPRIAIDVLVDDAATVQRLVDLLVVLVDSGTTAIALGRVPPPDSVEAQRRGHRITYVEFGPSRVDGPVKREEIRNRMQKPLLAACNQPASTNHDELIVIPSFTIAKTGAVETVSVEAMTVEKHGRIDKLISNQHPAVVECVSTVIRAMTFPAADAPTTARVPFGLYD